MNTLDWLEGHRFQKLERLEYDWVLQFDGRAVLVISCLWRFLEESRVRRTSEDHDQWFGLSKPVDAAADVNRLVQGAAVQAVQLNGDTLDLNLIFDDGHVLQLLPDSSGYEAWVASNDHTQYIATGGGRLDTCRP
jgi:hypothetical protein